MAKEIQKSNQAIKSNPKVKYLYTKGNDYFLDGKNYIGEYHLVGTQAYTGPIPSINAKALRKFYENKELYVYDKARKFQERVRVEPDQHVFQPTQSDYEEGFVERFFVERVGGFEGYPLEINKKQADRYGKTGGIDEGVYNLVTFIWRLKGPERSTTLPGNIKVEGVYDHNLRQATLATRIIPNLLEAIKSFTEFAKLT